MRKKGPRFSFQIEKEAENVDGPFLKSNINIGII